MSIKTRIIGTVAAASVAASLGLAAIPAGADIDDIGICEINCDPGNPQPPDPGPGDLEVCTMDCGGSDDGDGDVTPDGTDGGGVTPDGVDEAEPAEPQAADPTFTG